MVAEIIKEGQRAGDKTGKRKRERKKGKKHGAKKDIFSRKKHEKGKCIHKSIGDTKENCGNEAGEKRIKKVLTRGWRSDIIAELA